MEDEKYCSCLAISTSTSHDIAGEDFDMYTLQHRVHVTVRFTLSRAVYYMVRHVTLPQALMNTPRVSPQQRR
jgi:hypothetical protein